MATVDDEVEFGGATTKEIRSNLRIEAERLRGLKPEVKATDRALEPAHLVNALVVWYMQHTEREREGIARDGVMLYQVHRKGAPLLIGGQIPENGGGAKSVPRGVPSLSPNLRRKSRKAQGVDSLADQAD